MGASSRADEIRYDLARNRARSLLTLRRQRPAVDVQAIIDLASIPIVERTLPNVMSTARRVRLQQMKLVR